VTQRGDENYLWEFQGEDFVYARLNEDQAAAEAMPAGPERDMALNRIESLRLAAAEHCIYVDRDGKNWCRCTTCGAVCGVPCTTILLLARLWSNHPDYKPDWNRGVDDPEWRTPSVENRMEVARLGGYRSLYYARREAS
jgi:hypothetical protein